MGLYRTSKVWLSRLRILMRDPEEGWAGMTFVTTSSRVIDPELATEAWAEPDPLTDRERQVLRLAGDGVTSGDTAAKLSLSEGTIRNYLSEAISKLGANNRLEAAANCTDYRMAVKVEYSSPVADSSVVTMRFFPKRGFVRPALYTQA